MSQIKQLICVHFSIVNKMGFFCQMGVLCGPVAGKSRVVLLEKARCFFPLYILAGGLALALSSASWHLFS